MTNSEIGSPTPPAPPDMMQPPCPVCGQPMKLMQVDPVAPGRDRRVFECKCGHSEMREGAYT
jgi:hypothetical protein